MLYAYLFLFLYVYTFTFLLLFRRALGIVYTTFYTFVGRGDTQTSRRIVYIFVSIVYTFLYVLYPRFLGVHEQVTCSLCDVRGAVYDDVRGVCMMMFVGLSLCDVRGSPKRTLYVMDPNVHSRTYIGHVLVLPSSWQPRYIAYIYIFTS